MAGFPIHSQTIRHDQTDKAAKFVRKISKPFAKAAQFIGNKLPSIKPQKSVFSFSPVHRPKLSKAAKQLLKEANSTKQSYSPARTHSVINSANSLGSDKTVKVSNTKQAANFLRERALNSSQVEQTKKPVWFANESPTDCEFIYAAQQGDLVTIHNMLALKSFNFAEAAGPALEQALIYGCTHVFEAICADPNFKKIIKKNEIAERVINSQRLDWLETIANRPSGAAAIVQTVSQLRSEPSSPRRDASLGFINKVVIQDFGKKGELFTNLLHQTIIHGSLNDLQFFLEVLPANLTFNRRNIDHPSLLKIAIYCGREDMVTALLQNPKFRITQPIAQKALLSASDKNKDQVIEALLSNRRLAKACYSEEFIKETIVDGRQNLCGRMIKATKGMRPILSEKGFIRLCLKYSKLALEYGHSKLVSHILLNSGHVAGKEKFFDYDLMRIIIEKGYPVEILEHLMLKNEFDPSFLNNGAIMLAANNNRPEVIKLLLSDIRVFQKLKIYLVPDVINNLDHSIKDLEWQPKFEFNDLVTTIDSLTGLNSANQTISALTKPIIRSALQIRHNKAVSEAECLAKLFFVKGFDSNFVQERVTEYFGLDIFPLQSGEGKRTNILNLINKWEAEAN